ncbi:MAG TPA: isopentenyl-diphosphate Delta-isomerase [Actinomycetota bacterium]|nr:isopentenyl-diphosphate Delta-isomerase [Actinomycetota bacterium]
MTPAGGPPERIVLVDETGSPIGEADKYQAHHLDTPLHLAFSCYVFDHRGRFLATRRAAGKQVWPGVWTNSVCGHPMPGEDVESAIRRRLDFELGMTAEDLRVALPDYRYRSPAFEGIVENEYCPVYLARSTGEPKPNPDEVGDYRWVPWPAFVRAASIDRRDEYSWWSRDQVRRLAGHPLIAAYVRPVHVPTGDRSTIPD